MFWDIFSMMLSVWSNCYNWFESTLRACDMTGFYLVIFFIIGLVRFLLVPLLGVSLNLHYNVDTAYSSKPYVSPSRQLPAGKTSKKG